MLCRSFVTVLGLMFVAGVCIAADADKTAAEKNGLPLVYEDDFESGADNWKPTDEKAWKIIDSDGDKVYGLVVRKSDYNPPHRSPHNISLLKDVFLGDFVLTAKVKSTADTGAHRDMCVFFNYQDPTNYYYVHLGKIPDPKSCQIMIVDDAPRRPLTKNKKTGAGWTGGWHDVKVVRCTGDGTIEVYFDDMKKPLLKAVDKTFTSGQIGIGSFDDTGNWNDVKLYGKKIDKTKKEK
jgi:hypothetical protein